MFISRVTFWGNARCDLRLLPYWGFHKILSTPVHSITAVRMENLRNSLPPQLFGGYLSN